MLVKMFLCFYLNVPPWSFNLIHLSYDENKVEPVAGDLQSLEGMDLLFLKQWHRLRSQIQCQAWARAWRVELSGVSQVAGCLPSAWTSVGRSQTCSMCTRLFILFYLQTFLYRELGFCGSGESLTMVLISVWRAARPWASHIASLNFHVLIYEFRTRWLTSNDFQVCDPEPVNWCVVFCFCF